MTKLLTDEEKKKEKRAKSCPIYTVYEDHFIYVDPKARIRVFSGKDEQAHTDSIVFINLEDVEFSSVRGILDYIQEKDPKRIVWFYEQLSTPIKKLSSIEDLLSLGDVELESYFYDYEKLRKITFPRFVTMFFTQAEAEKYIERINTLLPNRLNRPYIKVEEIDVYSVYLMHLSNMLK